MLVLIPTMRCQEVRENHLTLNQGDSGSNPLRPTSASGGALDYSTSGIRLAPGESVSCQGKEIQMATLEREVGSMRNKVIVSILLCLALLVTIPASAVAAPPTPPTIEKAHPRTFTSFTATITPTSIGEPIVLEPIMVKGDLVGWYVKDRPVMGNVTGDIQGTLNFTYSGFLDPLQQGNIDGSVIIDDGGRDHLVGFASGEIGLVGFGPVVGGTPSQPQFQYFLLDLSGSAQLVGLSDSGKWAGKLAREAQFKPTSKFAGFDSKGKPIIRVPSLKANLMYDPIYGLPHVASVEGQLSLKGAFTEFKGSFDKSGQTDDHDVGGQGGQDGQGGHR